LLSLSRLALSPSLSTRTPHPSLTQPTPQPPINPLTLTTQQRQLIAYAGVGVVCGSDPEAEWQELCLKARQFETLLAPRPALAALPNAQLAWAAALVEELCRLGVGMFCIAPGGWLREWLQSRGGRGCYSRFVLKAFALVPAC